MSQKKGHTPVSVNVTGPDRRISESSTQSSSHGRAPPSVGKGSSVTFRATGGTPHHLRDSLGQLLLFPVAFGQRRRSYSWQGHPIPTTLQYQPTYRLEPTCKVPTKDIEGMMEREIHELLHDLDYSVLEAANWSKVLGERLKCETKHLLTVGHRYKIVCTVAISQNCQQGIQISSRCLWEKEFDTVISTTYDSKTIHVTASVYCIYTP